ncbi:unnamed protein product [Soboliphyme baturini]|uniref:DUF1534 domain-containing protein n=1 Tax=Soboliphyme baturini TaxID=241478 RepID=A0A183IZP1_9BILA|nr:unnamed protein product [Soboliphyme baturini]
MRIRRSVDAAGNQAVRGGTRDSLHSDKDNSSEKADEYGQATADRQRLVDHRQATNNFAASHVRWRFRAERLAALPSSSSTPSYLSRLLAVRL